VINLVIDGQKVQVEKGKTILEAATSAGIFIPTLCYHKALPSYGACRLCIVEINEAGRLKIETSCTYPAIEGIEVKTNTPRLQRNRRIIAELLLARCPDVEKIKILAGSFGATGSVYPQRNDDCIQCGLCVRMCRERM